MKQRIIKVGHSLAIVIPSGFVKSAGLKKGNSVEITVDKNKCKLRASFKGVSQLPLSNDFSPWKS